MCFLIKEYSMKRNLDVIRKIMIYCEETLRPGAFLSVKNIPNSLYEEIDSSMTKDEFMEHFILLEESRLIEGKGLKLISGLYAEFMVIRITSTGHDFLDALRNETVWSAVKEKVNLVGGVALSTMIDIAKDYIKKNLLGL